VLALAGGAIKELWDERRRGRAAARLILNEVVLNYGEFVGLLRFEPTPETPPFTVRTAAWDANKDALALSQSLTDWTHAAGIYEAFRQLQSISPVTLFKTREDFANLVEYIEQGVIDLAALAGFSRQDIKNLPLIKDLTPAEAAELQDRIATKDMRDRDLSQWMGAQLQRLRARRERT
jgi:hypothetical protein